VALLDQQKGNYFWLNTKTLTVKKKDEACFILYFKPTWVMQHTGTLTLRNELTKEEYEYELKGYGEEPLASYHYVLNCKARETKNHTFEVKNYSDKTLEYQVWTDLQNAVG